jgi:hypothetical protein
MTQRERHEREWMQQAVERLGFTHEEFYQLRRISMTLHRWHEHECNGNIQRPESRAHCQQCNGAPWFGELAETGSCHHCGDPAPLRKVSDGKPRWFSTYSIENDAKPKGYRIADREHGALRRLGKIVADANTRFWVQACKEGFSGPIGENPRFVHAYVQGDPRGAALYLVPVAELRGQQIDSVYSRGVAIY